MNARLVKSTCLTITLLFIAITTLRAQPFAWAKGLGTVNDDRGFNVKVDSYGNVYTVGTFQGTVDFDPGAGVANLSNASTTYLEIFVTKFDPFGNFVWAKQIGNTSGSTEDVTALEIDNNNNLIITGYFTLTPDFDPNAGVVNLNNFNSPFTTHDAFVLKLTDQGTFVWVKQLGGTSADRAMDVAVDASDNVFVTGLFNGTADFDPGAGTANLTATGEDCFILKLTSAGNYSWVRHIAGTGNEAGEGIAVDPSGNVIVTGYYSGTADLDPSAGTQSAVASGAFDFFVTKLNPSGTFIFSKSFGGTGSDVSREVEVDGNGNIVIMGTFAANMDADPDAGVFTLTAASGNDGVLIQLNSSGNLNWAAQLGSSSASAVEVYYDLSIDADNNVYASGCFNQYTLDFDPGAGTVNMISSGLEDAFIQKLTSAGVYVNAWKFGGASSEDRALGIDATVNAIHTTGYYSGTSDMDPSGSVSNISCAGVYDVFVQKLGCIPPPPTITTSGASLAVCSNNSTVLTATGTGTLGWYSASSAGTYLGGGTSFNTGNLATTTTFYVQDSTACGAGPRTALTVTVNDGVIDQALSTTQSMVCVGGSANINLADSELGVDYYLRDDATNAIIQGPVAGTGNGLLFNTGAISSTTTYNILGSNSFATNRALDLDGTNDYVDCGTNNRGITSTLTVSGRVRTNITGTSQFIAAKYLSGGIGYYLYINGTGYASIQGRDQAGAIKSSGFSTTMVADNQWHDITGVIRGTVWEIWVDGVLQSSATYTLGATGLGTTASLLIGQFGGTYTPMDIDRLAIWNTGLSPATILSNASSCLSGAESNLVGYFTFSEASGTTTNDGSPSNIDGTLTNMSSPACWIALPSDLCPIACESEMSQTITITTITTPPTPTISAGGPTTFCAGGSVTLTSSSPTGNTWSTGATTQSIVVSVGGTYTVTVGAAGCSSTSAGTVVTVNAAPSTPTIAPGGPTTFCAGGSVTLTSSTGTSYLWSTGATTQAINVTTTGTYTVQVTNASGCQSAASAGTAVTVNALPSTPTITPGGPTTFCAGGSVTLTSSSGTSYLWSNGATTQSINATTAGTYTVQVTNAAGCQSAASAGIAVTVNALPSTPTITPGGPTTFCAGGSVTLTSSSGTSYLWSNGATTPSINATTTGTYTVQVTNASGCQSAASAGTAVTVNALPSTPIITPGGPTTFCAGGSVTLSSTAATSYLWSNGATTPSINATTAGTYTVQVTNAAGCQSVASSGTTVTVNALPSTPTITPGGPTTFCAGGSVTLTSSSGTGYLWSDGSMSSFINPSSSGTYTVQVSNAQGCLSPASSSVTVTVNALPNAPIISPNGPTIFCQGGTVNLASSAGITYLWSTGATTPSIDVTNSGSFSVQITGPNGCQSPASAVTTVTVNPTPSIAEGTLTNPTSCTVNNGSIEVTGSGTGDLSWSGTASGSLTNVTLPTTISGLNNGTYNITFTSPLGCASNVISSTLTAPAAPAAPTISAGGSTTFCDGASVTLTASTGSTYVWSNGETTQSITVSAAGNYTVSITDASGCSSPASSATTVVVNALPVIGQGTVSDPLSCVANDGSIEVTGSGTGDLSWTGAASGNQAVATLPAIIPNLGQGNYSIAFTDANGCISTNLSVTLVAAGAPSAPVITPDGAITFCEGGSVTLTSSSATSYQWSNGETTQSIIVDEDGTFSVTITDANGCISPSSVTTTVTVDQMPDLTVNTTNNVITANESGATYQWIDCNNANQPIAGETSSSFTPTSNGSYAVIITSGTCSDTSACVSITTIGISEQSWLQLGVHPNPGHELVNVTSSSNIVEIDILSMRGEYIRTEYKAEFSVEGFARGIYLLKVTTTDGTGVIRLAVE